MFNCPQLSLSCLPVTFGIPYHYPPALFTPLHGVEEYTSSHKHTQPHTCMHTSLLKTNSLEKMRIKISATHEIPKNSN